MKAQAIIFEQPDRVSWGEVDISDPRPGEVQIRTEASMISVGTERWVLQRRFTWADTPYPCVPGYQRVGTITKLGAGVDGFQEGERVAATVGVWEGAIRPANGSHIAAANTPVDQVYKLPAGVHPVDASGLVVAQVGYNAASRLQISAGEWVIVYGDGLIGQCGAQAVRARGARTILVGHRDERLQLAARYSADAVINSGSQSVSEQVSRITQGAEVAAILDTVQQEQAQREYMPLLERKRGKQIVYSGFTPAAVWADMALLQQWETTCHFVSGWQRERMEATLQLMAAGQMRLEPLVTHRASYLQGGEMYRMVLNNNEPYLGICFEWK